MHRQGAEEPMSTTSKLRNPPMNLGTGCCPTAKRTTPGTTSEAGMALIDTLQPRATRSQIRFVRGWTMLRESTFSSVEANESGDYSSDASVEQ